MLVCCLAFYPTVQTERIIVRNTSLYTWKNRFNEWSDIPQCVEMISKTLSGIKLLEEEIEKLSREWFYNIHMHKLLLDRIRG